MARSDDEELRALLDELEGTLVDLRAELDDREQNRDAPRRRRRGPPTPDEVLRFTGEYTIPAVVATLEATTRALERFGEMLRVTTPGERRGRPPGSVGQRAVGGAERAMERLQTALAEGDLPSDPAARELVEEARSLSEEIATRLGESERSRTRDRGVGIEVREEGDGETAGDGRSEADPAVDVEAELASIRDELDEAQDET